MKKIIIAASLLTACVAFANPYAKCAGCHGATGEKAALGKSKIIKDMPKAEFVAALKGYQDGSYGGVMKNIMKGQVLTKTDSEIETLATFISNL